MKKKWEIIDPFFYKQPSKDFINELKGSVHIQLPNRWGLRKANQNEIDLKKGVKLYKDFGDPNGLLDTAYNDFERFLELAKITDGNYPLKISYAPTECFEAYRIEVQPECCNIIAADTEGIRRALIYIEDEMLRREGPFLPMKTIQRKPFIKSRITRCFFSPTNRPPKNGEELGDEIDYYPEEYLNRLAHDGINGIWIYTHFRDLLPSKIIPEYGSDYVRRIDKLNKTIEKCAKYGIKVYILAVEPASTYRNEILFKNQRELLGNQWGDDFFALCTEKEKGAAYAEESTRTLFTLAPELAGLIVITVGESRSHCGSAEIPKNNCPCCKDKPVDEILSKAVASMEKGVHSVKPEAEFISWPYGQRGWGKEAVIESAASVPENVILMHNFEDLGEETQLGHNRLAIDYWLSYVGPSEMFERSAKAAKAKGREVFAKLQVCCSHEVASVPYVPVPGILYKKYKAMRQLEVDGVMQCWYFGNYPSIMSKAAGELAFESFDTAENEFLEDLAGLYWGANAKTVVDAWRLFESGYRNIPLNIAFSWYGPMHDGPVWPLHLLPKNLPLAGTWLTYDAVGGDRIGECMLFGHDLEEAITLCQKMSDLWKQGINIVDRVGGKGVEPWEKEQKSVAKALDCQFESGLNILRFYKLREELGLEKGDQLDILNEMRSIVKREIEISMALSELSQKDKRLGYHSEGEGFKYFPEKLTWRISLLEQLLKEEFVKVEERIKKGISPLEFYQGIEPESKRYVLCKGIIDKAPSESFVLEDGGIDNDTFWSASVGNEFLYIRINCRSLEKDDRVEIWPEFRPMWPYPPFEVTADGEIGFRNHLSGYGLFGKEVFHERQKWNVSLEKGPNGLRIDISIKLGEIGFENGLRPFRLNLVRKNNINTSKWVFDRYFCQRLIFGELNHNEYGWIIDEVKK